MAERESWAEKTEKKKKEERRKKKKGRRRRREMGGKKKEEKGRRRRKGGEEGEQRKKKTQKSNPAEMYFLAETHRNSRNTPKHPEIAETPRNFTRGGMRGVSYR